MSLFAGTATRAGGIAGKRAGARWTAFDPGCPVGRLTIVPDGHILGSHTTRPLFRKPPVRALLIVEKNWPLIEHLAARLLQEKKMDRARAREAIIEGFKRSMNSYRKRTRQGPDREAAKPR